MAEYSVYVRESLSGASKTVPGRKEIHVVSTYFEYDNVEELAEYIRINTPTPSVLMDFAHNSNLTYKLEVVYTEGFLGIKE